METESILDGVKAAGRDAATLRVYVAGADEPKSVAIPKVRSRWHKLRGVISKLDVVRVEILDKGGALVGVIEDSGDVVPAYDGDELERRDAREPRESDARRDERLLSLMLKAQDVAMARRESEVKAIMAACTAMVTAQAVATKSVIETYQRQGELAREAMEAMQADGGSESMSQVLPALMPMLLPIAQRMGLLGPAQLPPSPPAAPPRAQTPTQPLRPVPQPPRAREGE